jgi:hypothetical protein
LYVNNSRRKQEGTFSLEEVLHATAVVVILKREKLLLLLLVFVVVKRRRWRCSFISFIFYVELA